MRMEVHLHADIPILEGVSRKRIEEAIAPLLDYLDADSMAEVKSLEQDEPGLRFDEKELMLTFCWTGEVGRNFREALEAALANLGPLCYEAVEVELTLYPENAPQETRLLYVGPTAQAVHEARRRCMIEDVTAVLAREFDKERIAEVVALVNRFFDQDWKNRAAEPARPERAFETTTRPSRKHLH